MNDREKIDSSWKEFGGMVGENCRFCEERHVGCHSDCEKYLQAKQKHADFKEVVFKNKGKDLESYHYKLQKIKAENRKSKWGK